MGGQQAGRGEQTAQRGEHGSVQARGRRDGVGAVEGRSSDLDGASKCLGRAAESNRASNPDTGLGGGRGA